MRGPVAVVANGSRAPITRPLVGNAVPVDPLGKGVGAEEGCTAICEWQVAIYPIAINIKKVFKFVSEYCKI